MALRKMMQSNSFARLAISGIFGLGIRKSLIGGRDVLFLHKNQV